MPVATTPPSPPIAYHSWSGSAVVAPSPPTVVFSPQTRQHSFFVRALWYIFIGWWLSGWMIVLGYLCMLTLIGIPLGFYFFNRIPQVVTLRARTAAFRTEYRDGVAYVVESNNPQYPWFIRGLWFIFIGWWLGALWLVSAWLIGFLIVTLPISIMMYNRTSGVMTLQRH
ncbi:MAG: YccF domain-containing protein [Thermomicrobiales bacterium]